MELSELVVTDSNWILPHPYHSIPCPNLSMIKALLHSDTRPITNELVCPAKKKKRNQASRGEGPWRLIGNRSPVNVNGNWGSVDSDWLYPQTTLSWINFLQPWHCWHGSPPLSLSPSLKEEWTKETRLRGEMELWEANGIGKRDKTGQRLTFSTSGMFLWGALVMIWKGALRNCEHQRK